MVSNSLDGFARQSLESRICLLTESQMTMEKKRQLLEARVSGLEESNQQLAADIQMPTASATELETITQQPRQSLESQISLLKESQLIMEKRHQRLEARISRLEESNQQRADAIHIPTASATEDILQDAVQRIAVLENSVNKTLLASSIKLEQIDLVGRSHQFHDASGLNGPEANLAHPGDTAPNSHLERHGLERRESSQSIKTSGTTHSHTLHQDDVKHETEASCTHQISENIWESSILVNMEAIGWVGTAFLYGGLTINIVLQLVFVFVVNSGSFLDSDLPDPESLWEWRETQAHHADNMIMATRTSLARAICDRDEILITATNQQILYTMIYDYSTREYGIPIGVMLCSMVLFMWTLIVGQEFCEIFQYVASVLNLPRSSACRGSRLEISDEGIDIVSCSITRRVLILLLTAVRLGIAVLLFVSGCIWQAETVGIQDLVLNAAALTMIMELDELIFASLIPMEVKIVIRQLKPLPYTPLHFAGTTLNAPMTLLGAVATFLMCLHFYVFPNVDRMDKISEAMCGGLKDFVFEEHQFGLIAVTGTRPPAQKESSNLRSFNRQAIYNVITTSEGIEDVVYVSEVMYFARFENFIALRLSDVGDQVEFITSQLFGTTCEDYDFAAGSPALKTLIINEFGARACSDLEDRCAGDVKMLRMVCPKTCGCDQVHSGLYKTGVNEGCPRACAASPTFSAQLASIPCKDYSVSDLQQIEGWAAHLANFLATWTKSQPRLAANMTLVAAAFMVYGCGAFAHAPPRFRTMMCQPTFEYGSLRPYCPVSCGCVNSSSAECPTQCSA